MKIYLLFTLAIFLNHDAFAQVKSEITVVQAEAKIARSTVDRMDANVKLADNYEILSRIQQLQLHDSDQTKTCKKGQVLMDLLKLDLNDAKKFSDEDKRLHKFKIDEFKKHYADYNDYFNQCLAELNARSAVAPTNGASGVSK